MSFKMYILYKSNEAKYLHLTFSPVFSSSFMHHLNEREKEINKFANKDNSQGFPSKFEIQNMQTKLMYVHNRL